VPDENELKYATPAVIEVAPLLEPVSPETPAGTDLRLDESPVSDYYQIKDARNQARAVERAAIADPGSATEPPDWSHVLENAPVLLTTKAKDLEIVAWYLEALIRERGLAGLRDGFRLTRELCERYWDGIFPSAESEGVEGRVAPLTGLNGEDGDGTLIGPIKNIAVTEGTSVGPFNLWQYEQALEVDSITDVEAKQRRLDAGAIAIRDIKQAITESTVPFFRTLRDDLAGARDEFSKLCAVLDEKAGSASPPSSNIRNTLERLSEVFGFVTAGVNLEEPPPEEAAAEGAAAADGSGGGGGGGGGGSGAIRTRDDAFRQLEKIAAYFHQTEPHSPLAFTLNQAVRWGKMPLPELLTELIPDEAVRLNFFKMTGIRPPDAPPPAG
jgi:type VI secretion system protein ImpA